MKEKVLTLCRRLQKCTLDDLVSYLETDEDIIKTALLYLENEGLIKEDNGIFIYSTCPPAKHGHPESKNYNIMTEYRTPEELDIIIKGYCLEISSHKICKLVGVQDDCISNYYGIFRKRIFDRQFKKLLDLYAKNPQQGRYRKFYDKYAYFYVYNNQVFVSDRLLKSSLEKVFTKPQIREFKIMYCYLARIECHNMNKNYMFYRLAEYIWRKNRDYDYLYDDLKNNLLNNV